MKEIIGQCQYHLGDNNIKLRLVQLTPDGKEWQYPIFICRTCRYYLKGKFRYVEGK